ncbi:MAG: hypothetical protein GXO19_07905 [Epsilonproteobacteria bacterium]|nr:hypothetical protein [Campylobacterota bacterium]NPA57635.1 hypothetical protein [Campylobacterota bacterium]
MKWFSKVLSLIALTFVSTVTVTGEVKYDLELENTESLSISFSSIPSPLYDLQKIGEIELNEDFAFAAKLTPYGGDLLYVGYTGGFTIIDVSQKEAPQIINEPPMRAINMEIDWADRLLFAAMGTGGFGVYDISDPLHPSQLVKSSVMEDHMSVDIAGTPSTFYVADMWYGFHKYRLVEGEDGSYSFEKELSFAPSYGYDPDPSKREGVRGLEMVNGVIYTIDNKNIYGFNENFSTFLTLPFNVTTPSTYFKVISESTSYEVIYNGIHRERIIVANLEGENKIRFFRVERKGAPILSSTYSSVSISTPSFDPNLTPSSSSAAIIPLERGETENITTVPETVTLANTPAQIAYRQEDKKLLIVEGRGDLLEVVDISGNSPQSLHIFSLQQDVFPSFFPANHGGMHNPIKDIAVSGPYIYLLMAYFDQEDDTHPYVQKVVILKDNVTYTGPAPSSTGEVSSSEESTSASISQSSSSEASATTSASASQSSSSSTSISFSSQPLLPEGTGCPQFLANLLHREFDVKGYFYHYGPGIFDWLYVSQTGRLLAKLKGMLPNGNLDWEILTDHVDHIELKYENGNEYFKLVGVNEEKAPDYLKNLEESWIKAHGFFFHYGPGAFDWLYLTTSRKYLAKLDGMNEDGSFKWVFIQDCLSSFDFDGEKISIGGLQ